MISFLGLFNILTQTLLKPTNFAVSATAVLLYAVVTALITSLVFLLLKLKKSSSSQHEMHTMLSSCNCEVENLKLELTANKKQISELHEVIRYQKDQFSEKEKKHLGVAEKIDEEVLKKTGELQTALEKSQESNKLKEAFLEKISREVRTPLNAILGFINLLNDPNLSKIDREYYFKFIRESGNNLLTLIDNIVDFTKLETGELQIEARRCNLNLLFGDLIDKYRGRISRENPEISIIYNKAQTITDSLIDCKRIIHITDQLLNNAIKFTTTGQIELSYSISNDKHIIEVHDSGIGIEEKYQDIIFERFYQIEESRDVFQGAGLGLTIAKGVTDLLGGDIKVNSKPNKGSKFTVEIPFKELPLEGEKVFVKELNYDWENNTILIAEDEDSNFYFLEAILKKTKVNIIRAEDGVMFLEIMNTNKNIDLVLLDIKMPGINGLNAIKVVRQQNINIPVIAQTAFNQAEDKQRCLDSGCNDYLAKPIDRELLLAKIANFI